MQWLQEDTARDAQVQQLAQLERHSCLGQEVKELRQACWGMLLFFWGSMGLSWEHVVVPGGSPLGRAQVVPPFCLSTALGGDGGCEAAAGEGEGCPDPAHVGAVTGSGRAAPVSDTAGTEAGEGAGALVERGAEIACLEQDCEQDEVAFHRVVKLLWMHTPAVGLEQPLHPQQCGGEGGLGGCPAWPSPHWGSPSLSLVHCRTSTGT
ncbi:uncharacterized protein LOC134554412 [Prinia subflava]|uniref:uncharacterized protein LOC134554412 n=1 Tax=Prinia subflava TaxID=208062 RepID=UPI002FE0180C